MASPPSSSSMSSKTFSTITGAPASVNLSSSQADTRIDEILDFWLSLPPGSWFGAPSAEFPTSASLDDAIRARFQDAIEAARAKQLDETWTRTPRGTLALLLLLDQFPRNIYRGSSAAFASDAHALAIATQGIAKGFDKAFGMAVGEEETGKEKDSSSLIHRVFFYLPFSHTEDLGAQIAAVALLENLVLSCPATAPEKLSLETSFGYFKRHRAAILRLGRFPARNVALGRRSTDEEVVFLKVNPHGF